MIKYLLAIALAVTPAFSQTQVIYDPIGGRLIGGIPIGGGTGSVITISVVTANGVSGSVANPTTTPAITLTLGAITPSSVTASGAITSGSGSAVAGAFDLAQGTLPALATTAISFLAPTSVTSYGLLYPGTAPAANQVLLQGTPASGISTGVFTTFSSTNLTDTATIGYLAGTQTFSGSKTFSSAVLGPNSAAAFADSLETTSGFGFSGGNPIISKLGTAYAQFSGARVIILSAIQMGCVKGAAAATCGVIALASGTATITTAGISTLATSGGTGSVVILNSQTCSNCGALSVGTVVNGTSFVINSTNVLDASNVYWEIRNVQ